MNRFLSVLILLTPLAAVRAEDPPKVDPYDQSKVALSNSFLVLSATRREP